MKTRKASKKSQPAKLKCRICGGIVSILKWRGHLRRCHNIDKHPRRQDFFIDHTQNIEKSQKEGRNSGKKIRISTRQIDNFTLGRVQTVYINRLSYSERLKGIKGEEFEEQFYCDRCGKRTSMGWRYTTIDGSIKLCQNCMTAIEFNQRATIIYTPMGNKR